MCVWGPCLGPIRIQGVIVLFFWAALFLASENYIEVLNIFVRQGSGHRNEEFAVAMVTHTFGTHSNGTLNVNTDTCYRYLTKPSGLTLETGPNHYRTVI